MNFSLIVQKVKAGGLSIAKESARMVAFVAELNEPDAIKECKSQASAVLEYLAQRNDLSVQEYNAALTIKLRAEHRLGEVLAEKVSTNRYDSESHLPDEIEPKQSSRAQQFASIPWGSIEERIAEKTERNAKASQAGILRDFFPREKTFDLVDEANVIYTWLSQRKDKWPLKLRNGFAEFVQRQLHRIEVVNDDRGRGAESPESSAGDYGNGAPDMAYRNSA